MIEFRYRCWRLFRYGASIDLSTILFFLPTLTIERPTVSSTQWSSGVFISNPAFQFYASQSGFLACLPAGIIRGRLTFVFRDLPSAGYNPSGGLSLIRIDILRTLARLRGASSAPQIVDPGDPGFMKEKARQPSASPNENFLRGDLKPVGSTLRHSLAFSTMTLFRIRPCLCQ